MNTKIENAARELTAAELELVGGGGIIWDGAAPTMYPPGPTLTNPVPYPPGPSVIGPDI